MQTRTQALQRGSKRAEFDPLIVGSRQPEALKGLGYEVLFVHPATRQLS